MNEKCFNKELFLSFQSASSSSFRFSSNSRRFLRSSFFTYGENEDISNNTEAEDIFNIEDDSDDNEDEGGAPMDVGEEEIAEPPQLDDPQIEPGMTL